MNTRRLLIVLSSLLLAIALGVSLWISPFSIGLKLKYGNEKRSDLILLDAARQLQWYRHNDSVALQEVVEVKLKVAENQVADAGQISDKLLAKQPNDPELLVIHARINLMAGHPDRALVDLSKAKEAALHGGSSNDIDEPSPAVIDEMIEHLRAQLK